MVQMAVRVRQVLMVWRLLLLTGFKVNLLRLPPPQATQQVQRLLRDGP